MISGTFCEMSQIGRVPNDQDTCGTWYLAPNRLGWARVCKEKDASYLPLSLKEVSELSLSCLVPPWRIYWPKFLKNLSTTLPLSVNLISCRYKKENFRSKRLLWPVVPAVIQLWLQFFSAQLIAPTKRKTELRKWVPLRQLGDCTPQVGKLQSFLESRPSLWLTTW